jgi:hypothetical protein
MTKDEWMTRFVAEFRKGVKRGAETDAEHEAWLRQEAEAHFEATAEAITTDPEEEARAVIDAITVLS